MQTGTRVLRRIIGLAGIVACSVLAFWRLTIAAPNPLSANVTGADYSKVERVVNRNNGYACRRDSPLVMQYQNAMVLIFGYGGPVLAGGWGLLTNQCSKIVSAAHVLYKLDKSAMRENLRYKPYNSPSIISLPTNGISEGDWKTTDAIGDDTVSIQLGNRDPRCPPVNTKRRMDSEVAAEQVRRGSKFYLLKYDISAGYICAQQCNLEFDRSRTWRDGIKHDCDVEGGNSGAPMFMIDSDGDAFLIGVQKSENIIANTNSIAPISGENVPGIW